MPTSIRLVEHFTLFYRTLTVCALVQDSLYMYGTSTYNINIVSISYIDVLYARGRCVIFATRRSKMREIRSLVEWIIVWRTRKEGKIASGRIWKKEREVRDSGAWCVCMYAYTIRYTHTTWTYIGRGTCTQLRTYIHATCTFENRCR